MSQGFPGYDRDMVLIAEETAGWGLSQGDGVAAPITSGGLSVTASRAFIEPRIISGVDNDNVPNGIAPRGSVASHLYTDSLDAILNMGITRGAASDGNPLSSFTVIDNNQGGVRLWTGVMSSRMSLRVRREDGSAIVSHDVVGKQEEAGPEFTAQSYDPAKLVTAAHFSITLNENEWLWEDFALIVDNGLVEGPPFGTAGYPTSLQARSFRNVSLALPVWRDADQAFIAELLAATQIEAVITIAHPDIAEKTITVSGLVHRELARSSDERTQRDSLDFVCRKGTAGNIVYA